MAQHLIGGVCRDGYIPHSMRVARNTEEMITGLAYEFQRSRRVDFHNFRNLRRYAYYGKNGGLSRAHRRMALAA